MTKPASTARTQYHRAHDTKGGIPIRVFWTRGGRLCHTHGTDVEQPLTESEPTGAGYT